MSPGPAGTTVGDIPAAFTGAGRGDVSIASQLPFPGATSSAARSTGAVFPRIPPPRRPWPSGESPHPRGCAALHRNRDKGWRVLRGCGEVRARWRAQLATPAPPRRPGVVRAPGAATRPSSPPIRPAAQKRKPADDGAKALAPRGSNDSSRPTRGRTTTTTTGLVRRCRATGYAPGADSGDARPEARPDAPSPRAPSAGGVGISPWLDGVIAECGRDSKSDADSGLLEGVVVNRESINPCGAIHQRGASKAPPRTSS